MFRLLSKQSGQVHQSSLHPSFRGTCSTLRARCVLHGFCNKILYAGVHILAEHFCFIGRTFLESKKKRYCKYIIQQILYVFTIPLINLLRKYLQSGHTLQECLHQCNSLKNLFIGNGNYFFAICSLIFHLNEFVCLLFRQIVLIFHLRQNFVTKFIIILCHI